MDLSLTRRSFLLSGTALAASGDLDGFGPWSLDGNGRDASMVLSDQPSLRLGTGDFTISVWVYTEERLDDGIGDIACQYDPVSRRGFHLTVKTNYATTTQSNYRQLSFGIDNGRLGDWMDCGRPGSAIYAMGLIVFRGDLYAGTCEPGEGETGRVYRYAGGARWIDCGAPVASNAVSAMAVYEDKLYVAAARYNTAGSSLPPSPNEIPGGAIYRYEGGRNWTDCGRLGQSGSVGGMAVYRGRLYATSMYKPAGTFRYEGGRKWSSCGTPDGRRVNALAVYDGSLYGASYDGGYVFRYEGGSKWTTVAVLPDTTQTYGFAVYQGKLYVSTWPNALVYRLDGDDHWSLCGRLGEEQEVMGMAVYNGKLYAGTLPLAQVYRYEGGDRWALTGRLDHTPDVRYRRAWSMAVYRGKLFCGTLPSGHVHSLEAGKNVTWDHVLQSGWRHVVAMREGRRLKLSVNGSEMAISSEFDPLDYDLSCDSPLQIGFGAHDYFNGRIRELRLYRRALTEAEIRSLAHKRPPV